MRAAEPWIVRAPRSERLFVRAQRSLVGGVNSPVRAFRAVGGIPRFIVRGQGPWIEDADDRRYIDYCGSWGALLLGHAHPGVVRAIREAAKSGTSFGAATEAEIVLAEAVRRSFPSIDLLRFVNSGTEATMSAVRAARGFTGRERILTFEGGYHGHADAFLAKAGSGLAAAGLPASRGVPRGATRDTLVARFNDLTGVERLFSRRGPEIAAVVVEPVAGNMGVVPPEDGFLEGLRTVTEAHGALLIFDEVITGFRIARGGGQERFGVRPDLTCLGKILGHGLPIGAYGGRREVMDVVAPVGPVYQAGTLAGNPLAMAAGLATLGALDRTLYQRLERASHSLENGFHDAARDARIRLRIQRVGSMLGVSFRGTAVRSFREAKESDATAYARLFWSLLGHGVYLPPAPYETLFVSAAHGPEEIDRTIDAVQETFKAWRPSK
jgi:glutamate-1-semialdehyde 2,1-aminomutase